MLVRMKLIDESYRFSRRGLRIWFVAEADRCAMFGAVGIVRGKVECRHIVADISAPPSPQT